MLKKIHKISSYGDPRYHTYKYQLELPEWLCKWDVFDYWEKERVSSIEKELTRDDILFDIGAEHGWQSALYSKYVTEKIVLFEPSIQFWGNIKRIWKDNNLRQPLACYNGFVGKDSSTYSRLMNFSEKQDETQAMPYNYLHNEDDYRDIQRVSVDDFVNRYKIIPTALSIDVEGAEIEVLNGAIKTLIEYRPKLWISIHSDLLERDYDSSEKEVLQLIENCGYDIFLLAKNHEKHIYCK